MIRFAIIAAISFCAAFANAQVKVVSMSTTRDSLPTKRDSAMSPKKVRPYKEVITKNAVTMRGLFAVHKVDDRYYFEVKDKTLGKEMLVVNRLVKSPAGSRSGFFGYAGDQIGQSVVIFEKGPSNKIFLRTVSYAEYAKDSTSPMFTAVKKSNVYPIAAAFEIKAFSPDSTASVIDVTDYVSGDNDVLFFNSFAKSQLRLTMLQADKSFINSVRAYPTNIEISTTKTYGVGPATGLSIGEGRPSGGGSGGGNSTMELNSSIVLLPENPMQSRYFDPRVGYFAVGYTDFDANPQGVEDIRMVKRWRLEPKPGDVEKYKRGELVEPKKPIIFYIDPATPAKWVPYLMQGVNDWQASFEKAGFKNAIMGKLAPSKSEDSTWSLEDARYSAIVYKPSNIPNASGPSISDPRTGEIMESHINWYHNVMKLIHDWYMVQCAAVDPGARKMAYDDELMGQLIRFVSSHEVGHTLGLRHNFGSSSTVPVENLRNKKWVEANGHTPSIMDYARFNYVAQPEDNIERSGLFPRIGDYDNWAIEWGYRLFPQYKNPNEEESHLNNWVISKLKDKRLWFGTETNGDDPRSQSEQIGDDAMKASTYGIKNLQRIVPNLMEWTKEPNKDFTSLDDMYGQVTTQFNRYMGHVSKYVGGIMETPRMVEEKAPVYEVVPKAKQEEAVSFLTKQLFQTPSWLINNEIFERTGDNPVRVISNLQDNSLGRLVSSNTLLKLLDAEAVNGDKAYTVTNLLDQLNNGILSELISRSSISIFRRNLQKSYVTNLINLLNPPAPSSVSLGGGMVITIGGSSTEKTDVKSVVRGNLGRIAALAKNAAIGAKDTMTRYHLQDIAARIDAALNPRK